MDEHDNNDDGAVLWENTGPRPLPPHVTPAIRGERKPVDKPDKQTTDKESD